MYIPKSAVNFIHESDLFMPKILCIIGMAIAVLVFLIFLVDIAAGFPFSRRSIPMDVTFIIVSGLLAWMSWITYKELQ